MKLPTLTINHIYITLIGLSVMFLFLNFYQNGRNDRKTARIIETIDLLQEKRVIDSLNYMHITRNVDSLKARTAAQQAEITFMKGKLWHERQATKQLKKSVGDLLVIINERPAF